VPDFAGFERFDEPFPHWINGAFLHASELRAINAEWPSPKDPRWHIENGMYARKAALLFPRRLPLVAHALATKCYSPFRREIVGGMLGFEVLPDPWRLRGPPMPRLGGGLHEIWPGGLLKMHVDFSEHPSGLERAVNLLVYLNEDWREEWGGDLELGNREKRIAPIGGTAVLFESNGASWHGHPEPLACPENRTRRSLALYYYRQPTGATLRHTTVYRKP
jgi:hypothetical protein